MRESIKHMMIAMAGLLLASCNTIYEQSDCPAFDELHSVNFVLAIDPPGATRAEWGDTVASDEIGTSFENRITPKTLRVEIYDADNSYIGKVENLIYWPISEDGSRYQFNGEVPMSLLNDAANLPAGTTPEYKFMVFANCAEGDNDSIIYSFDELDADGGAIPMWGVKQADLSDLLANRVQALGTISLLRAAAKVEVIVDEALTDCTINSASINYHNRQGYALPAGWESAASTEELARDGVFRGYRSLHTSPHSFIEVEEGRKYVLYVPEYDNTLFADFIFTGFKLRFNKTNSLCAILHNGFHYGNYK